MSLLPESAGREWINGFLLLGALVGLLGSLLIVWQYHLHAEPEIIGFHFLASNAGYLLAVSFARHLLLRLPIRTVAALGCLISSAGLIALTFLSPPMPAIWRMAGLAVVGLGGGMLGTSLLFALEPWFVHTPAEATNIAGALFGAGCAGVTMLVAATYFISSIQVETAIVAIVPLVFCAVFLRSRSPLASKPFPVRGEQNRRFAALRDVRSVAAILLSLLLFFQSGNEFLIAGWLPLSLVHRLGANPVVAILALAVYFLALTLGRLAVRRWLLRTPHRRLLFGGGSTAMIGYLILSYAPSLPWIWVGTVLVGFGFAPIYPLLAEILDDRFSYHPGFYNGIFSVALAGAMTVPWLIGYIDKELGASYLMTIPALGSILVTVLVLLLMFEARLMGDADRHKGKTNGAAKAAGAGQGG